MWSVTLRDLQFRKRRFALGAIGAGLVFAMALVLAGMAEGFRTEAVQTVTAIGADRWVMPEGVSGPFTSFSAIPTEAIESLEDAPGVERADPIIVLRDVVDVDGEQRDVVVIGYAIGGLGEPDPAAGAVPGRPGELVADATIGAEPGAHVELGGRPFTVVGTVEGFTMYAGLPNVYVPIEDAQAMAFGGQRLATAIVTRGVPEEPPEGFAVLRNEQGVDDALRPLENARSSIASSTMFLWAVAAIIIGTIVYLTTLERVRDFAVLKAIGASSRDLFIGLAAQSVIVSLVAAALAAGVAFLLVPLFPMRIDIPARSFFLLPFAAVVVGVLASLAGLRRAIRVDPALAFGGAV